MIVEYRAVCVYLWLWFCTTIIEQWTILQWTKCLGPTINHPKHRFRSAHNKSKYINHVEVNWSEMWPNYYTRILNGYQIIGTNRQYRCVRQTRDHNTFEVHIDMHKTFNERTKKSEKKTSFFLLFWNWIEAKSGHSNKLANRYVKPNRQYA